MLLGGGFGVGRLLGVQIEIDWSLLIIFALILFDLGAGVFPAWHPEWSPLLSWSVALGAAVLFFVSVLVHELSHAVVAREQGIPVHRITLFLFGGLAHMEREPPSPKSEFWMAIVGPVTSIVIGLVATLAGTVLAGHGTQPFETFTNSAESVRAAFHSIGPLATLLLWLGPINLLLGVFNVIPGFPLDGGRVFRSVLWGITNDLTTATRWASMTGRVFAWVLMAFGAMSFFSGAIGQGLWLLLIGWFLNNAARVSYQQLLLRQALEDVPVTRVMQTRLDRVAPDLSLETFVREHLMAGDQQAFPVESGGQLVGLIQLEDLRGVPQGQWSETTVGQIMTPMAQLHSLSPDAGAEQALEELAQQDGDQLAVYDGRQLLGLVRRRDILKWLALQGRTSTRRVSA
jgi:Zn-dependent protease